MKRKIISVLKRTRKKISKYLSTNRLFLTFVIFGLVETILLRNFTLGNTWDTKPLICDLALLILIGAFGYFVKPKKQFNYYFIWMIIVTTMCVVNSIYYVFYTSYASFSLLAALGLVGEVGDSLTEKIKFVDFMYVIFPLVYAIIHTKLKKGSYYHFVAKVENGAKMFGSTILVGVAVLSLTLVNLTGSDISTLVKQWNRQYIVQRYGVVLYQGNDLVQSLIPKINSMFGYDEAAKNFKDYYSEKFSKPVNSNKYTGVLEGMNVIFIHMESIHNYLVDMEVNGQEIKFEKPVPIIVRNISLGGMLFSSPALLELGTHGQITFMEGKRPCYLFFNIVRVEDYSTPEKERPAGEIYDYRYGCQFEMLSDDAETALCGFVFQEDAVRRRKKKYQYLD